MPKNARSQSPKPKSNWEPPPNNKKAIFVRSELDDYGLDLYEFRVLAHVARRESRERGCDESQKNMARICGMSQRKVLEVLKVLCNAGILRKEKSPTRRTNVYRLNPGSKWEKPSKLDEIRQGRKSSKMKGEKGAEVEISDSLEVIESEVSVVDSTVSFP